MVTTVTLNPAIDYHIKINDLLLGKSLSSEENTFYPGGKGINVSQVLQNLGYPTKALAFVGGFTGEFIKSSISDFLDPIQISDNTRINTKIKSSSCETEIHGVAPKITEAEFEQLCSKIKEQPLINALILSGSIPPCLNSETYKKLAELCPKSTKIIIDTRGKALKESLKLDSIFLLKPNKDEIEDLFGFPIRSNTDALNLAIQLKKEYPIKFLILSLGAEGAYFLYENNVYFADALKGKLISSVGAGDSTVAGFIREYLRDNNPLSSFSYAIACGAATAFSHGLCTKETADKLVKNVIITKIN